MFAPEKKRSYLHSRMFDFVDGTDVMRSSGSFTLRPGAESAALAIPLFEDTTPESMEIFTVTLSAGQDVSLTVESANVTILDTDGERIIVHMILYKIQKH